MDLHFLLGQVTLGLILFRLFWGLIGSSTARFAGFVKGPARDPRLSARRSRRGVGHNPLGALSVLALLLLLATSIGLGLFASDEDGLAPGPLVASRQLRCGAQPRRAARAGLLDPGRLHRPARRGDPLLPGRQARQSGRADGHRRPRGRRPAKRDGRRPGLALPRSPRGARSRAHAGGSASGLSVLDLRQHLRRLAPALERARRRRAPAAARRRDGEAARPISSRPAPPSRSARRPARLRGRGPNRA